jgi:hypothetical protein
MTRKKKNGDGKLVLLMASPVAATNKSSESNQLKMGKYGKELRDIIADGKGAAEWKSNRSFIYLGFEGERRGTRSHRPHETNPGSDLDFFKNKIMGK